MCTYDFICHMPHHVIHQTIYQLSLTSTANGQSNYHSGKDKVRGAESHKWHINLIHSQMRRTATLQVCVFAFVFTDEVCMHVNKSGANKNLSLQTIDGPSNVPITYVHMYTCMCVLRDTNWCLYVRRFLLLIELMITMAVRGRKVRRW